MRKKWLIFCYITLMLICPVLQVSAIDNGQKTAIETNCSDIQETLKKIQKSDARTRVYLGAYYEKILSKYITPLNLRLVENSLSDTALIENQNNFAKAKTAFSEDFIKYQKDLEDLVAIDCKNEPDVFYEKLVAVRKKRSTMVQDINKLAELISLQKKLVTGLKGKF